MKKSAKVEFTFFANPNITSFFYYPLLFQALKEKQLLHRGYFLFIATICNVNVIEVISNQGQCTYIVNGFNKYLERNQVFLK